MEKLKSIQIRGFRSIKDMTLEFSAINVLIGANGVGKSNLIAFFKMMSELMAGRLQQYIATTGRSTANLHFGPKVTQEIEAKLEFKVDDGTDGYVMRLSHAAGDTLILAEKDTLIFAEEIVVSNNESDTKTDNIHVSFGRCRETQIDDRSFSSEPISKRVKTLLRRCQVYHFHDTSPTSRVRQYCYKGDDRSLLPDAANLAAVLFRLQSTNETVYRRIVATIRQVAPFFDDFSLEPTGTGEKDIILNWRHRKSDLLFGPHQLSDGTLRAICLISLLLQPTDELPLLIVVDEPELGLHPYALNVIAGLFKAASHNAQILISTQSSSFLDNFDPEDIIVVDRVDEASVFERQDGKKLESWLEEYTLGEVWEKNVIGGGPH